MPARRLPEPVDEDVTSGSAAKHEAAQSSGLCLAPVTFKLDGALVQDNLCTARDLQLGVGSLVMVKTTNQLAKITTLTAKDLRITMQDETKEVKDVKFKDIQPAEAPKKDQNKKHCNATSRCSDCCRRMGGHGTQ